MKQSCKLLEYNVGNKSAFYSITLAMWLHRYTDTVVCNMISSASLWCCFCVEIDNPSSSFTFTSLTTKQFTMQATQNKGQGRVILSQQIQRVGIPPQFGVLLEPLGCHSFSELSPSVAMAVLLPFALDGSTASQRGRMGWPRALQLWLTFLVGWLKTRKAPLATSSSPLCSSFPCNTHTQSQAKQ